MGCGRKESEPLEGWKRWEVTWAWVGGRQRHVPLGTTGFVVLRRLSDGNVKKAVEIQFQKSGENSA